MISIAFVALGYLMGSFPTGVLVGRLAGRDPRGGGSGNIGATNVARTLGKKWGVVTLALDALKGWLPAYAALHGTDSVEVALLTAFLAIVGHCYPVWLRFRGGKGVATAFGAMLLFSPVAVAVGLISWVVVALFTLVPAFGSLSAAVAFAVVTRIESNLQTDQPIAVHVFALTTGVLLLWRHRSNLTAYIKTRRKQRHRKRNLYRSRE